MTLRLKPGHLAFVTRGPYAGRIVEIVKYVGTTELITTDGKEYVVDNCWEISQPDRLEGVHKHIAGRLERMVAPDWILSPINGNEEQDTENAEVNLNESICADVKLK